MIPDKLAKRIIKRKKFPKEYQEGFFGIAGPREFAKMLRRPGLTLDQITWAIDLRDQTIVTMLQERLKLQSGDSRRKAK